MEVIKYLYGGAAYRAKYQVAVTHSVVGIPTLQTATNTNGLAIGTTTSAGDMVGITLDTATKVTAQQTSPETAERTILVDIRPDAVISCKMSGTTAAGGAIPTVAITQATTNGLDVTTTGTSWTSTSYLYGSAFCYSGRNAGQLRKTSAVDGNSATVYVAFEADHQIGDEFFQIPFSPMDVDSASITLCTELNEVRLNIAIQASTGAEFNIVEILARDVAHEGTTNSYVLIVANDHILNKLA